MSATEHQPKEEGVPTWPAGALLPEAHALVQGARWTWRTLRAAKSEIINAVDGMLDDLDGLGAAACGTLGAKATPQVGQMISEAAPDAGDAPEDDDPCIRVDDLRAPAPTRSHFEQELAPPDVEDGDGCQGGEECDGFELIDFEAEAQIIALR